MPLLALILAWILPGAGHAYLGRWKRGVIIFVTLSATFWGGMAMGGVMTVSPLPAERWWFIADMFTGVHGLAGWQIQQKVYQRVEDDVQPKLDPYMDSHNYPSQAHGDMVLRANLRSDLTEKELADENLALTAPGDSVARAYCGVAGLLNLMCMFDAVILSLLGVRGEQSENQTQGPKEASA